MTATTGFVTEEKTFQAMGTSIRVLLRTHHRDRGEVEARLERVERLFIREHERFSRFLTTSELSQLNETRRCSPASPEMLDVLNRSLRWFRETNGLFNPAIGSALEGAGYDRPFDRLGAVKDPASRGRCVNGRFPGRPTCPDLDGLVEIIRSDRGSAGVRLRGQGRLDLGGVVKGWAVDRAAELLDGDGGYLIDAGGDIRIGGSSPRPGGWVLGIADPHGTRVLADAITQDEGALATSSVLARRWRTARGVAHHLIDPRRGRPADSGAVSVSVIAPTAEEAEVVAKTALLLGSGRGLRWIESRSTEAMMFLSDGSVLESEGWHKQRIRV